MEGLEAIVGREAAAADPGTLIRAAYAFGEAGRLADDAAHRLGRLTPDGWTGPARLRFDAVRDDGVRRTLRTVSSSFHAAADELEGYGRRLDHILSDAARLAVQLEEANDLLAVAGAAADRADDSVARHASAHAAAPDPASRAQAWEALQSALHAQIITRSRLAGARERVDRHEAQAAGLRADHETAAATCAEALRSATVNAVDAEDGRAAFARALGAAATLLTPTPGGGATQAPAA